MGQLICHQAIKLFNPLTRSSASTHQRLTLDAMENLPDEILLLILSNIDDGVTLLNFGLLCKRFHRICKDPRAWAAVSLEVSSIDVTLESGEKLLDARLSLPKARILACAPALKRIRFRCLSNRLTVKVPDWSLPKFDDALRRCNARIKEVEIGEYWIESSGSFRQATTDFVKRLLPSARSLTIDVGDQMTLLMHLLEGKISMNRLEELRLKARSIPPYGTEKFSHGSCSSLKRFVYELCNPSRKVRVKHYVFVSDVLKDAAPSLRIVNLLDLPALTLGVLHSLTLCEKLTSLTVDVSAVPVLKALPSLSCLTLTMRYVQDLPDKNLVYELGTLAALRRLEFRASPSTVKDASCGDLLVALGHAAPGLQRLSLRCSNALADLLEADVSALLGSVPNLTEVALYPGTVGCLDRVMELRALRRFDTTLRVPAAQMEARCAMLENWKRSMPSLRGSVTVVPLKLEARTFTW